MRASTAFLVGVGTVGLAITGGLGGGLVIGNMMSPSPPKHVAEAAPLERPTPPQPMPASVPLPYVSAALAFTDPAIDGSPQPSSDQQTNSGARSSPPAASVSAATASDQTAKPADNAAARQPAQEAQQAPSARQASAPEDAYAKARDSDLKHEAYKRRAERSRHWADRHRDQDQNQNSDQQARDDRNGDGSDAPSSYAYNRSDHRYRDDRGDRYRDADRSDGDDRPPPYYVDEAPRTGFPRIQLFGPDD